MSPFVLSIRWALRSWTRAPFLAATAILTLALGVGVSTAVYSVVSGALLNVVPWSDPDRLVVLEARRLEESTQGQGAAPGMFLDWREQARAFEGLAALQYWRFNLTDGDDGGVAVEGRLVSADSFDLFEIKPAMGRGLVPADGEPGAPRVAVLSHGLWRRRYGEDSSVVGRQIQIDGEPTTIVGILGEEQFFLAPPDQLVMPLRIDPAAASRTDRSLFVMGLLRTGATLDQAQRDMELVIERLATEYPASDAGWSVRVRWLSDVFAGGDRATASMLLLLAAVIFVLLIVCANVANLLLARSAARIKEMATRAAVGGSRGQLARQLLLENALLALLAFPLALLVARGVRDFFLTQVPPYMGWMAMVMRFDLPVIGFAIVATLATVLLVGVVPAWQASRVDLQSALKEGGGRGASAGRPWVRQLLAVAQLGLAISLLSTSLLMVESMRRVQTRDPGFDVERVLVTEVQLPKARYPSEEHWREFERRAIAELSRVQGADAVASVDFPPYGFPGPLAAFEIEGEVTLPDKSAPSALVHTVSTQYLDALGLDLRRGRGIADSDEGSSVPIAIVNRTLAERYFGQEGSLGRRIRVAGSWREIVGVVEDYPNRSLRDPIEPLLLIPFSQRPHPSLGFVLRTSRDPLALASGVRAAMRQLDPQLPTLDVFEMEQRMENQLWGPRLVQSVMWILSQVALLLAAMGVYAVISYGTSQRAQEFAIRAALGAEPGQVALLVLRQAALLSAFGVLVALGLSIALSPLLARMLYAGTGWSVLQFGGIAAVLAFVALVAAGEPAWRAMRSDPMGALRAE